MDRSRRRELEPLSLKGKAEPVQAFVLGELLAAPERAEPADVREELPFVDRERERAVLGASVAPVRMGFGTLVELVGEPGIGKSRLAQELRENCADMRQIDLRCEQYESSTPYYPFRPFLRSLLDVPLNGGGEHNRAVLGERLQSIDEELVRVGAAARRAAGRRGRAHPGGERSRSVVLARAPARRDGDAARAPPRLADADRLRRRPLDGRRVVGAPALPRNATSDASRGSRARRGVPARTDSPPPTGTPPLPALTLRLEPLPEDDAKALALAAAGDRRLSEEEVAALMERAAGNPLFLRELASVGEKTEDAEDLPDTVETLVATRIDQLAPGDRALLRWASVLGVSFSGASSPTCSRTTRPSPPTPRRGTDSASSSSAIPTCLARSASATR